LCEAKERQIISLDAAMRQANDVLQSEMSKMNEQSQKYKNVISDLDKQIRELSGN